MDRYLILLLAIFLPLTSLAAVQPGFQPSIQLGGFTSQVASSPSHPGGVSVPYSDNTSFTLYAGTLSLGGAATVYPFYKNGGGSGTNVPYQVPSGKVCRCDSITYRIGSTGGGMQLVSATATFANATASGSVTGPNWQFGASGGYGMAGHATAGAVVTEGLQYSFAALSWPGFQGSDNTQIYQVRLTCREI